jgi:hypothetical protein
MATSASRVSKIYLVPFGDLCSWFLTLLQSTQAGLARLVYHGDHDGWRGLRSVLCRKGKAHLVVADQFPEQFTDWELCSGISLH